MGTDDQHNHARHTSGRGGDGSLSGCDRTSGGGGPLHRSLIRTIPLAGCRQGGRTNGAHQWQQERGGPR